MHEAQADSFGHTVCNDFVPRASSGADCFVLQAALRDLEHAEEIDAWDEEVAAVRCRVLAAQRAAEQHVDRHLAAKMIGRG